MHPARPLVLAGVAVVDPRDGTVLADHDVVVEGGRIASVRPGGGARAAGAEVVGAEVVGAEVVGAEVVDGAGRFVVPGFVDVHAHPLNRADPTDALELMLASGITGFRQMSGTPELLRRRREGELDLPPHSPALLALPGAVLTPVNAGTPDAARAEVRRQVADGADFVKAALIRAEVLPAVQEEAARLGVPVLGHLPTGADVRAASRSGMRSIEHLGPGLGVLAACSSDEEALRAAIPRGRKVLLPPRIPLLDRIVDRVVEKVVSRAVVNPLQASTPEDVAVMRWAVDTFDEGRARDLARRFVADGTWHCPTLVRIRAQQQCADPAFRDDPDLRFVAPRTVDTWNAAAAAFVDRFSAADRAVFDALYEVQLRLLRILDEEGVPLLAGTDAVGAAWVVAGSSLHREFDQLARAGLSPLRILRSTTIDAARFLGTEADAGTVEPGKLADLVLLDGDPTRDHANLHGVTGVVRAGVHHPAAALERMRDAVAARGGVV